MSPVMQLLTLVLAWLVSSAAALIAGPWPMVIVLVALPVVYWALVLRGSDARAEVAERKLQSTLMKHETVIVSGLQKRIGALLHRRRLVALTNSRVVVVTRGLLGGFTMQDHQWKDLRDATLRENLLPNAFGSRFALSSGEGVPSLAIDALPSDVAARMYAHAQAEEQAWEEKKRVRALEETRAASGGVIVGAAGVAAGGGTKDGSMLEALDRAKKLFDSGAISDAEYQELKSKILNSQAF